MARPLRAAARAAPCLASLAALVMPVMPAKAEKNVVIHERKRPHPGGKTDASQTERAARERLYDEPSQPAVVRKTPRHPDAFKLEVDFD